MAANGGSLAVPDCVREALAQITRARGWKNPEIKIESGSNDGDGYLSVLYRILIQHEDESLSLMCKTTLASMKTSPFIAGAFRAESFMYNKILPAMEEIANLRNPLPWPRAYPVDVETPCLVMEDLRPEGFAITGRCAVLDVESCQLLVVQLARLHGAGMALERLRPDLVAEFKKMVNDPAWEEEVRKVYDPFLRAGVNAEVFVTDRFPEGSPVNEKLKELFASYAEDFYDSVIKADPEGVNTIAHGDCHVNNVLFRRNEAGVAAGCRLIDFQMTRFTWPVAEVCFILLSTTEKALRDEHWHALMQAYYEELQATLRAAGIPDPESLFSRKTFQAQVRRGARLALGIVPTFVHFFNDDDAVKDIQDTLAQVTSDDSETSAAMQIKDTPLLRRRFGDAVENLIEWGYL